MHPRSRGPLWGENRILSLSGSRVFKASGPYNVRGVALSSGERPLEERGGGHFYLDFEPRNSLFKKGAARHPGNTGNLTFIIRKSIDKA
jgi:hypothetical protein